MQDKNENSISERREQMEVIIKTLEYVKKDIGSKDFKKIIGSTSSVFSILDRYFPNDTERRLKLKGINNTLISEEYHNDFGRSKSKKSVDAYKLLLENLIFEINTMGLPSDNDISFNTPDKTSNEINVNMQQSININFNVRLIKEAFSENQLEEIKELIKGKKPDSVTKTKLSEKLKDFGINALSEVILKLLTNTDVYSKLFS